MIKISFPYDKNMVEEIKTFPFTWFKGQYWVVPAVCVEQVKDFAVKHGLVMSPKAKKVTVKHPIDLYDNNTVRVYVKYSDDTVVALKDAGCEWSETVKGWVIDRRNVHRLSFLDRGLFSPVLFKDFDEGAARTVELYNTSTSVDATVESIDGLGFILKPYQQAVVDYVDKAGSTIVSSFPGAGKTVMSVAVVEKDGLYPCVVVCEQNVKSAWEKHFPTHRSVQVISGRTKAVSYDADVLIVNQDILVNHEPFLGSPKCLVVDESSNYRNGKSLRSKAAVKLGKRSGLVLCLTGTPFSGRKNTELLTQLKIIGKDRLVGGYNFLEYSSNSEVNRRLRETCMIRQRLVDVHGELADTPFFDLLVDVDCPSYEAFKRDMVLKAKAAASMFSEYGDKDLVDEVVARLGSDVAWGALLSEARRAVAFAKLPFVKQWVDEVLLDPTEKVVLFAHHVDVVESLMGMFGCEGIYGKTSDKQGVVDRFQAGEFRVVVCNFAAGGKGITLDSASRIVAVESDWSNEVMVQASARSHMRGVNPTACPMFIVKGRGTVDEYMCRVRDLKRVGFGEVIDGVSSRSGVGEFAQFLLGL
jgi:superfamily II DNA or RNA helicase